MTMTPNILLWTLDNITDTTQFERLCVDLLVLNGYHDLVPIGGAADRGRDAEVRRSVARSGERTFFQFTVERRWEPKLRLELEKVERYRHEIDVYGFITTHRVSGAKRDQLAKHVSERYGWELTVFDREWLRVQLEEVHPELAKKYFGLDLTSSTAIDLDIVRPAGHAAARAFYDRGEYDASAVELRRWLRKHPTDGHGWTVLAWCEYEQSHYVEALDAITQALRLQPNDLQTQRIYAGILVERGSREEERASVVTARDFLARIVAVHEHAMDYYNYGNALFALGDNDGAREAYMTSLERDPTRAEAWKNLGSVYARLGKTEDEARCYDRALELNPDLPEALLAKGIRVSKSDPGEGATLIRRALKTPAARTHWPSAWHWLADALYRSGDSTAALDTLDRGLALHPNYSGLRDLKAHILSTAWRADAHYVGQAEAYFRFCADAAPKDFRPIEEIAHIYLQSGREDKVWPLLTAFIGETPPASVEAEYLAEPEAMILAFRHLRSYKRFRDFSPIEPYLDQLESLGVSSPVEQRRVLIWQLGLAYGRMYGWILDAPRTEDVFLEGYAAQKERVGKAFTDFIRELAASVRQEPREAKVKFMSVVAVGVPELALVETSRQLGFAAGVLSFPINQADPPTPPDLGEWQKRLLTEVLTATNGELKLLREDPEEGDGGRSREKKEKPEASIEEKVRT
jgi:tetratricopeptide (TPR) repeat protein